MKKFYLTTAIAYVNAPPHMGHAFQFIITDALARWHRLKGEDVFFLTGTDEYGTKLQKTAEKLGKTPEELTNENSEKFRELDSLLSVSYNCFIRTSDRKIHWPTAHKIWKELVKSGDIYKKKYKGLYCYGCESFKTDRELVDGKCPEHDREPEIFEEENYFFRLTKYRKKIERLIVSDKLQLVPKSRKNEALNILKKIGDISFSRSVSALSWGIPVPDDESHVIYVWCDALTSYLSGIGYSSNVKNFKNYWPADLHILGKDNLKFHAIFWPAMLLSAGLPLPKKIFVHGFITSEGRKMSKTIGNVVDPFVQIKKYGSEPLRYFLMKEIPSGNDGDFSEDIFVERINSDLADALGNLVNRVLVLIEKMSDSAVPKGAVDAELKKSAAEAAKNMDKHLAELNFSKALENIWKFIDTANKYVNISEPWKKKGMELDKILYNLAESVRFIAVLLTPFMPVTSEKILAQLSIEKATGKDLKYGLLKSGTKINRGDILFRKVSKVGIDV